MQRGGSVVPKQLVRLGAAVVTAGSMSMITIAIVGGALSGIGMRRSEAVMAAIIASVVCCPLLLLIAWRWGYSSRHSTATLAALSVMITVLAIVIGRTG